MDDREFSSQVCYLNFDDDASQAPGLCNQCKDMINAYETTPIGLERAFGYVFYETTDLLESTAIGGCGLCQLFLQGLSPEDRDYLRQNKFNPEEGEVPIIRRYRRICDSQPQPPISMPST